MQRLTGLSFAHPAVAADRRALLCLPGGGLQGAHRRIRSHGHDAFLLSTCLRVEIVWAGRPDIGLELLTSLYGDDSLSDLGVMRADEDLFFHLCRIAAGLESPVVGETEVLSQFRQAVAGYRTGSNGSEDLAKTLGSAIGVARATRRRLERSPTGSLASVAAKKAAPSGRVAILGAGAMAQAAAHHLDGVEVSVFARRSGVVGGHWAQPWESAPDALADYPAVISTIPGSAPVFTEQVMTLSLGRRSEPLLLIDLGMPPGFSRPRVTDPIRYLGVDEVASFLDDRPSARVERTVSREAGVAWNRLTAPDRVGSVIAAMVGQAERAVDEEVRRFADRLPEAGDPEPVLRQLAHTVARRVLHPPISFLGSTARETEAVDTLAEAFGVDDE